MHNVLIGFHAAAGVASFVAGAFALPQTRHGNWPYPVYLAGLIGLVAFMVGAVAVDWPSLDGASRGIYLGLIALGGYMLWRGGHAGVRLRDHPDGWRRHYLDDLGFTLISLFDGFIIVGAIDLGAPTWLVVAVAVLAVVIGIWIMNRVKAHLLKPASESHVVADGPR
jgi:uncharacterized membrane protein YfcA